MANDLVCFFDTETSGMIDWKSSLADPRQPDIIQVAAVLSTEHEVVDTLSTLVDPTPINPAWRMDPGAEAVHGISRDRVLAEGMPSTQMLARFMGMVDRADVLVCHNTQFDSRLFGIAFNRQEDTSSALRIMNGPYYCTMKRSTNLCKLPGKFGYKWPKLSEIHRFLFDEDFEGAHDALADVMATRRVYYEMKRRGL